jgi:hypothetical protein
MIGDRDFSTGVCKNEFFATLYYSGQLARPRHGLKGEYFHVSRDRWKEPGEQ